MKHTKKAALMLATVPVLGALAFTSIAPFEAEAHGNKGRSERMEQKGVGWDKSEHRAFGALLKDHGKHRGWMHKNPEAAEWMKEVHDAIKDNDYDDFKDVTKDTPLGDKTTKSIFEKLSEASDEIDDKDYASARDIMKELRDDGYRFKQLLHESMKKRFPRNS